MKTIVDTSVWLLAFRKRILSDAARFFNTCRTHGVQGSHIDFLISAVAANNGFAILTLDNDFSRYAQFINLSLVTL